MSRLATVMVLLAAFGASAGSGAAVPLEFQARLLCKVLVYEREATRSASAVSITLLRVSTDAESAQMTRRLRDGLEQCAMPDNRQVRVVETTFTTPGVLMRQLAADGAAVLYVLPGLSAAQLKDLVVTLSGARLLTVAVDEEDVDHGVVLGFGLSEGRAQLRVHLTQARRQHVDFPASFLALARIVQ